MTDIAMRDGLQLVINGDGQRSRDLTYVDGIARLVDWYRQHQAWAKDIQTG